MADLENRSFIARADALCQSFVQAWQDVGQGDIGHFLKSVPPFARETMFRNFLSFDIRFRRQAGEEPQADEYLKDFADYSAVIQEEFQIATVSQYLTAPTEDFRSIVPADQCINRLGKYEIVRQLGKGGMGCVYEAIHLDNGSRVALKTLPVEHHDGGADGANRLHSFKREFRELADISHPNLVGLYTLEVDGPQWFFTMDLLQGTDFLNFVRPAGRLDAVKVRSALHQLTAGVAALHDLRIIHRDLKPSNVIVDRDGHLVILDFGLVANINDAAGRDAYLWACTPLYAAPEQGRGEFEQASDWYAVGVMLYEALSGAPPYKGDSPDELFRRKQAVDAPTLDDSDLPQDLAALAMALLNRDPSQRPTATDVASIVAPDDSSLLALLAHEEAKHGLIGREKQIDTLLEAFRRFESSTEAGVVQVVGKSGEGKSALVGYVLGQIRASKQVISISGRCYDRESVPFKALDSFVDALVGHLSDLPQVAQLLPDDTAFLSRLFPALNRIDSISRLELPSQLDDEQVAQRGFIAFRQLLFNLSRLTPLVMFIDDLQWGDADSARALFEMLRPPDSPRVFFVGSFRSDEADESPFLTTLDELCHQEATQLSTETVTVGPLDVEDSVELLVEHTGRNDAEFRELAAQCCEVTGGNPFLLVELAGCFDAETQSFRAMPVHEVVRQKLARIDTDAEPLLNVIAVSGQGLLVDEAYRTAGHDSFPVSTVMQMRKESLVRLLGSNNDLRIDTYHDKIRETQLADMQDSVRTSIHQALGECIERKVGLEIDKVSAHIQNGESASAGVPRVYDLAYHFDRAKDKRRAWVYGLHAGEQAQRQRAVQVAVNQFQLATRNSQEAPVTIQQRIAEGLGASLTLVGRYDEAKSPLKSAQQLADGTVAKARVAMLRGDLARKQSSLTESTDILENTLRELGLRVPGNHVALGFSLLKEVGVQLAQSLLPRFLYQRRSLPDARKSLIMETLNTITRSYWFTSSIRVFWCHLTAMNRAERYAVSPPLAANYALHACIMASIGMFSRSEKYGAMALEFYEDWNDRFGVGTTRIMSAFGQFGSARYLQARRLLHESIAILNTTGDRFLQGIGWYHLALTHLMTGELDDCIKVSRSVFHQQVRLQNDVVAHSCIESWARASSGDLPFEELRERTRPLPDDIQSCIQLLEAEGIWHLRHRRTKEAVDVLDQAFGMACKNVIFNWMTLPTVTALVTALRLHADAIESTASGTAERTRKRALVLARRASRVFRFFPTSHSTALREYALMLAKKKSLRKAYRIAERSCQAAERRGETFELAHSRLVKGQIALTMDRPDARQRIADAEQELARFQASAESAEPLRVHELT